MSYPELKLTLVILERLLHQVQEQFTAEQFTSAAMDLNQAREHIVEFFMPTESVHFESLFHELGILPQFDSAIIVLNTIPIDTELLNFRLNYLMACCQFLNFLLYVHVLNAIHIHESTAVSDSLTDKHWIPSVCRAAFFKKPTVIIEDSPNFYLKFNLDEVTAQLALIAPEDKQRLCLSVFAEPNHELDPAELTTIFAKSIGDSLWIGTDIARLLQTIKDYRQAVEEEPPDIDDHPGPSLMY